MNLLTSLGINSTLWLHVVCFAVSYFALSNLVFKPYARALKEREGRTVGSENAAVQLLEEAAAIQSQYDAKAKLAAASIKKVFDQSRAEAMKEYEEISSAARNDAALLLEQNRKKLSQQVEAAKQALQSEIPSVTTAIASKIAGREISL